MNAAVDILREEIEHRADRLLFRDHLNGDFRDPLLTLGDKWCLYEEIDQLEAVIGMLEKRKERHENPQLNT